MRHVLLFVVAIGAAAAAVAEDTAPPAVAEPQIVTGRFTTATEVRPILTATRTAWIATREWGGQDLIYVTHLWAWRCGLTAIRIAINGGPAEVWPMPACHEDQPAPNAVLEGDGAPYRAFARGSIERIDVMLTYDDLGTDSAAYDGAGLLLP
ncbi:MAG: hypothetical protein NXH82_09000 [Rhodobacteraceae bacterium]|nr:hypothetical protein [Paracoccaceae bacterium]